MEYKGPSPDRKIQVMFASTFLRHYAVKILHKQLKKYFKRGRGGHPVPRSWICLRSMTITLMTCKITGAWGLPPKYLSAMCFVRSFQHGQAVSSFKEFSLTYIYCVMKFNFSLKLTFVNNFKLCVFFSIGFGNCNLQIVDKFSFRV